MRWRAHEFARRLGLGHESVAQEIGKAVRVSTHFLAERRSKRDTMDVALHASRSANETPVLKSETKLPRVMCSGDEEQERDQCAPWFLRELELSLPTTRAFVALGSFAWVALFSALAELGHPVKRVKFGHGVEVNYEHNGVKYLIMASFHPSQQNTFTGKLTKPMLDSVLKKAGRFAHVLR